MQLGDIYDSAFRIIRYNPRATVGAAAIVALATMALPVLLAALVEAAWRPAGGSAADDATATVLQVGFVLLGLVGLQLGTVLVAGVVAHVTHAAATGHKIGLAEAWAATRGKRWRLLGLALLGFLVYLVLVGVVVGAVVLMVLGGAGTAEVVLVGVVLGLLAAVVMVWLYTRCFYLAPAALVLEQVGVVGALVRAFRLTRRQFWRTFGIMLLTMIVVGVAAFVLELPITILSTILTVSGAEQGLVSMVLLDSLSTAISSAFTIPFTAGVITVQYLDQRIRKEAYDVELMQRAGITGA